MIEPGLLDLAAPALAAVDDFLGQLLPDALRVVLYGLITSYLGMLIYARLSNQPRLRAVQRMTRGVRAQLRNPDIEFAALLSVSKRSIALSLRHLWLVFKPSLPAMLPFLLVFPWLSNEFGPAPPAAGSPVQWCADPASEAARVHIGTLALTDKGCASANWPSATTPIRVDGETVAHAPWSGSSGVLHSRQWWNRLIGNPAGYLPQSAGNLQIFVSFPARSLLPFGPAWLGHWLLLAFVPGFVAGLYWRWRWKLV